MKDGHIVEVLESVAFVSLSDEQRIQIETHVESCDSCRQVYEAAQFSSVLLQERVAQAIEPPPFFHTRVLAAWRERQAANDVPVFRWLWNSAGALVSSMVAVTATLALLVFISPSSLTNNEAVAAISQYSAEAVLLDQGSSEEQLNDDEVLSAVYVDEEEAR